MTPDYLKPKESYDPGKHGELDPGFRYADGFYKSVVMADIAGRKPMSEANRYRLVKASKSPTAIKPANWGALTGAPSTQSVIDPLEIPGTPEGQRAAYAVIQFREWSDEYRIRTRVETSSGTTPPEQFGPRITDTLTARAARKVAESCAYVSAKKGGYRTFFTLTFDREHRAAIDAGETTIQREVSRFMDGLQKMWRRGWRAEFEIHGRKLFCVDRHGDPQGESGQNGELLYVWVAEVPDNSEGKPNPHVHVLINWRVKYALFPAWAKRIESLWGQGMAHIEKIKDTDAAASYMMKAAGYLCKAQGKSDQGQIRGNRYGISAAARAPEWETLSETQLHIMGRLIADISDHLTTQHGADYQRRNTLRQSLDKTGKGTKLRRIIGRELQKVREKLAGLPIVASKYQLIIKGGTAFWQFYQWALGTAPAPRWLPEKGPGEDYRPGETRPSSQWYGEFQQRHYWRRSMRRMPKQWTDWEFRQAKCAYAYYPELEVGGDHVAADNQVIC